MDIDNMKKVAEALKARDDFLITAHVNPEGDSIGSQLAVYHILKKMKKNVIMVNNDGVPDNLRFLSGMEQIMNSVPKGFNIHTAVVLDCPVSERTGSVHKNFNKEQFTVNIDHHVSNEFFGDVNWVEPELSSVGEMVFHLAKELEVKIDKNMAEAIYAAIVTDTGMFNYDNTSSLTHEVVAKLITRGASPKTIFSEIFEKKAIPELKLLGQALTTLKVEADGRLAYMTLTRKMYENEGVESVATDEFIRFPRSIKGVEVAVFFKENCGNHEKINISFRSSGKFDVNSVASRLGGGGHAKASGCTLDSSLEEAQNKVLAEVKTALECDK